MNSEINVLCKSLTLANESPMANSTFSLINVAASETYKELSSRLASKVFFAVTTKRCKFARVAFGDYNCLANMHRG
jgi:hypothetical protein